MIKEKIGVNKHKISFFFFKTSYLHLSSTENTGFSHILMLEDVINILWHFCVIIAFERKVIEEFVKPPWPRKIGIVMQKSTSQNNSSSHSNRRVGLYLISLLWTWTNQHSTFNLGILSFLGTPYMCYAVENIYLPMTNTDLSRPIH